MRSGKPELNHQVAEIAMILAMHAAAMKPSYLTADQVPQSVKD